MTNDLISRSALIKELEPKGELVSGSFISGIVHAIHQIKNAPAVDAVAVVRCKDCAKCDHVEETPVDGGVWICHLSRMLVYENHFCSYGKRRSNDG